MKAVVVAHGEVDPADAAHLRGADLIVAADGGSEHLRRWGVTPHVVVGDLDSAAPSAGVPVERHPRDKDKTDTELALERALAAGADEVVVLGGLGGPRADHALANVLLLAGAPARVRIVRGDTSLRAVRGGEEVVLGGRAGGLVTLLAVGGDASGVWTRGLRYALEGGSLPFGSSRGVSNEITATPASVRLDAGTLLVIETSGGLSAGTEQKPQA